MSKKRREIVVSTLGFPQLSNPVLYGQEAVDAVIKNLDFQLSFVLPNQPDVIVFPEACDRFSTHTIEERKSYYRLRGNQILEHLCQVAKEHSCYIAYSAVRVMADGSFRNSTQFIDRQGEVVSIYNKNHCVVTEISDANILCGKEPIIVETDFGRVGFVICFDLNFHELREQYVKLKPDLLLFSSMYQGGVMQSVWAYTIGCYFVGAVADEENTIINPVGVKVANSTRYSPYLTRKINLDYRVVHLDFNWNGLMAMREKYGQQVDIYDGGQTGVVLVSSNSNEFTADEVCQEFGVTFWEDYYQQSLAARVGNTEI